MTIDYRRTHTCGEIRSSDIASSVTLSGWVERRRDHGGLIFIDLRDRYGVTQLVFDPEVDKKAHELAHNLRSEWVISVQGEVIPRAEGMLNPKMATGEIELKVGILSILSQAKTPPFSICDERIEVGEELRLKYRFLDLRRKEVARNFTLRHKAMKGVRDYFDGQDFLEIQTPIMAKSTPEGARDYLVPSRIYPGHFYALPQSPQIFKQLLMCGGMDRYFQIAPCFRDEDLRADRQPEFTQVDLEMSFCTPDVIFELLEGMCQAVFQATLGKKIETPFRQIPYAECMEKYGTDKPDLRFGMELVNISDIASKSDFSVFKSQIEQDGLVKGLCVKGGADISRKGIEGYTTFVGQLGIQGLAWMKMTDEGLSSNIVKFFSEDLQKELIERFQAESGDMLFMVADQIKRTNQALDHLRRKLARDRDLIPKKTYEFLWVTAFPLFSWNDRENRIETEHHPFTAPLAEDLPLIDSDPMIVRSSSYDLVLNGYELGSGSQRIYDQALQTKIFETLKLSHEEIHNRFGFFVEALQYGTPPHLGFGLGFDRLMMILCDTDNIRDVIAFPKTQKAADLMMDAHSPVGEEQLDELKLHVDTAS